MATTDVDEEIDDPRPSANQQPVRPALETLQLDQRALVDATDSRLEDRPTPSWDLRQGFPDRRAVVEWYQRATIRTLGHFADAVPPTKLVSDRPLVDALIGDDADDHAHKRRRQLEEQKLLPACRDAYDDLRGAAGEYIEVLEDNSERDPLDFQPEKQANLAMRPAFSHLDHLQHATLTALWGGFETSDRIRDWMHSLNRAANGQAPADLPKRTMTDRQIRACLLDEPDDATHARRVRERYAIVLLLPAFVDAVDSMETGELAKRRRTTAQTYQFGES
jgi:hypothetical protein